RALVTGAHRHVDQFLGEGIQGSGSHDLLHALPGAAQRNRIVRQCFPEIIDPIRVAGGHDVVINRPHLGIGVGVFDEPKRSHYVWPPPKALAPRSCISSGESSSLRVAMAQWMPKGSRTWP